MQNATREGPAEWVRLHRLNQCDIPGDADADVVRSEVRRILNGDDAPYDELPPFDRLVDLVRWLDDRGWIGP